jgi:hypothetical protein
MVALDEIAAVEVLCGKVSRPGLQQTFVKPIHITFRSLLYKYVLRSKKFILYEVVKI